MRAMWLQGADLPCPVAEQDDLLAKKLLLALQVLQFIRGTDGLPVAPQQLTHWTARLYAGQFRSGWRGQQTGLSAWQAICIQKQVVGGGLKSTVLGQFPLASHQHAEISSPKLSRRQNPSY